MYRTIQNKTSQVKQCGEKHSGMKTAIQKLGTTIKQGKGMVVTVNHNGLKKLVKKLDSNLQKQQQGWAKISLNLVFFFFSGVKS